MRNFSFLLFVIFAFAFSLTTVAQDIKSETVSSRSKGNPDAKVKLEVFNDYQCPTCAVFSGKLKILEKEFPNDLQITFRHFPLTMIHKNAMSAAQAIEAAGLQGKFWEMADLILEKQKDWSGENPVENTFIKYAEKLNLDVERFKLDLGSQSVRDKVDADAKVAKSLNLTGTPTVFFNGRELSFNETELTNLEKIIKETLNK